MFTECAVDSKQSIQKYNSTAQNTPLASSEG